MSEILKEGKVIIVCGGTGGGGAEGKDPKERGKSPFIKNLVDAAGFKNRCVFDRRKEYTGEKYPEHKGKYTYFFDFETFTSAMVKARGSAIIFEESTGFISNFNNQELSDICSGVEHNLSIIFFVFHNLASIPPFLIRLSHYVVLFPSIEVNESDVENNRELLFAAWKKVKATKKPVIIDVRKAG